jgi:hypothetical protein
MRVVWPGICAGLNAVTNSTYFACDVGLQVATMSFSGMPTHGITIDQASTQRMR